ncbi:glycylpeptide N-tetradecanoyltransferase [Thecaphora frezii]
MTSTQPAASSSKSAPPAQQPAADPAATLPHPTAEGAHDPQSSRADDDDDDDDDGDEAEDEDEDAEDARADANATAQAGASTLTAKQRKKKKSKAAAKLRKKLGLASAPQPKAEKDAAMVEKQIAAASSHEGKISDEVVQQVQRAVQQEHGAEAAAKVNKANLAKVMAMMNLERDVMLKGQDAKAKTQKALADHKFWKTQPVMKPGDKPLLEQGPIEPNQPPEKVRAEPYPLPADFEWVTVDIDDETQLKEVYDLLSANYVEDDDASLRFNYSPEFLHWVLKHPGYRQTWHIGVRVKSTRKMVAFISGIPHELRVRDQSFHSTEINFLVVHKKLRNKRLAPVLIKEVTRQCHLTGVFQAIYTAGAVLPTPCSTARYYHRTINAKKLVDIGFSAVPHNMSMEGHVKRFELPSSTSTIGLREMRHEDVPAVGKLLRRYMRRFDMAPRFSDEEVSHIFLSGRGVDIDDKRQKQVTWTYVVENPETHRITDVFSFYSLPSSILDNPSYKELNAAYLFYYATDVIFQNDDGANPSDPSTSSSDASGSSASVSPLAKAKASGVPEWQLSHLTGLSPSEMKDEDKVTRWDQESSEVKQKLKRRLNQLCSDALVIARDYNFDVVNCLTVMDNSLFLQEQKFGPGDGFLRFYLFNWRVFPIAGGMGARPGESDLDPVAHYLKSILKEGDEQAKSLAEELIRRSARSPSEIGSGNGVVMV